MNLTKKLESLVPEIKAKLEGIKSLTDLESLNIEFLGRKGLLTQLMTRIPELEPAERPLFGQSANKVKGQMQALVDAAQLSLEKAAESLTLAGFDPSIAGFKPRQGSLHPITLVMEEICQVLEKLGFESISGPEVELDFYNFEALNFGKDHPARDMQDTLFVEGGSLLRTHTSPMQVRTMLERKEPPIAVIVPGRVYRRDSDLTHTPMFHQIEGLLVDKDVSLAHLRGTLTAFVRELFGPKTEVRFRPSFFPFTEPSIEVDISCILCKGKGENKGAPCRVCKSTGWLEVLGAGMIDPNVYKAVNFPENSKGFAFGLGVERMAMLKYGISDLRLFFENDLRFLRQFA